MCTRASQSPCALLRRSPKYWANPNVFDPDRFPLDAPVPTEVTQNFAYLPFGGGKRKCIGASRSALLVLLAEPGI